MQQLIEEEHKRLDTEISAMMASLSLEEKAGDKTEAGVPEPAAVIPPKELVLPTTTYVDKPSREEDKNEETT